MRASLPPRSRNSGSVGSGSVKPSGRSLQQDMGGKNSRLNHNRCAGLARRLALSCLGVAGGTEAERG